MPVDFPIETEEPWPTGLLKSFVILPLQANKISAWKIGEKIKFAIQKKLARNVCEETI